MLETPNRDRRAERRTETQREIVEAAWTVARREGLAAVTLRDIARLVGMKAPSLYTHVESKAAIYDAMFEQAWTQCRDVMAAAAQTAPTAPRAQMRSLSRTFFDFCVADATRHQLMNTRAIPGFEPSPQAYQPAVETLDNARQQLRLLGLTEDADLDLLTALIGGLVEAQIANDPGGDRWSRLLDRAVDMFADSVHLPSTTTRSTS